MHGCPDPLHTCLGNIWELQTISNRMIITKGASAQMPQLPSPILIKKSRPPATLAEAERDHILTAWEESNWIVGGKSVLRARLGIARTT